MNAKNVIELAAAATPFVVARYADKKFIIPAAVAAAATVYAYNKSTMPGYAPFCGDHNLPLAILIGLFGGGVALAYYHPNHALIIGAAALAAIIVNDQYFYGEI